MKQILLFRIILTIAIIFNLDILTEGLCIATAFADGDREYVEGSNKLSPKYTAGSDASFDKRLPPVLPGEEVRDGENTMKVWSTSGSVSSGIVQAPQRGASSPDIGSVGVIVDERNRDRREQDRDSFAQGEERR